MCDNPVILNLHLFICQASDMQWTTEKQMRLPTWLRLGLKIQDRHFGLLRKIKAVVLCGRFST